MSFDLLGLRRSESRWETPCVHWCHLRYRLYGYCPFPTSSYLGLGSALCMLHSDYTQHGSPVAIDRGYQTLTGETVRYRRNTVLTFQGVHLLVKSETIKINGVDTAIENSYISYLDTTRGYRTFGLDGIHRLGVLMYNDSPPLAVMTKKPIACG